MHQTTRDSYNTHASSLSRHYDDIGTRDGDINLAFMMAGNPRSARVLEIGCVNGRDAADIVQHAAHYRGIDASSEMVAIARQRVPAADFEVADATTYEYGGPYDIIFAFALFRHMTEAEVRTVLDKMASSLRIGGIVYISSPYALTYHHELQQDEFGVREMHYYNPALLQKHGPASLHTIHELYDIVNGVAWFEAAFRKQATHS